ncbi:MAG: hypothetical protein A3I16_05530 [Burkholderiales bacterium RIFCSPLOWO2_02_FULL_66_35]|nr:MAG: hypothetical protein A3I16_05530 [Burkholderiales bacterium RIFCSPLOWO2_02_FULL_66_35]
MAALERRIADLEQVEVVATRRAFVLEFVEPHRGVVAMRSSGDLESVRLDHETEVQFLDRAQQEMAHAKP